MRWFLLVLAGVLGLEASGQFRRDSAWIVGRIEVPALRGKVRTGQLMVHDRFTGESFPQVVMLDSLGRFEVGFPVVAAGMVSIDLGGWQNFYVEPGARIEWRLWVDFERRARRDFSGDLAELNTRVQEFRRTEIPWSAQREMIKNADWESVQRGFRSVMDNNLERLDGELREGKMPAEVHRFLSNRERANFVVDALSYASNYGYYNNGAKLPAEFFDFMRGMPLDDIDFFTAADWVIFNRVAYMQPLMDYRPSYLAKSQRQFFAENGVAEDEDFEWFFSKESEGEDKKTVEKRKRIAQKIEKRHAGIFERYMTYRQGVPAYDVVGDLRERLAANDSLWRRMMGREPGFMMDVVAMNRLEGVTRNAATLTPAQIVQMHRAVYDHVEHPFLRDEVWRHYEGMIASLGRKSEPIPEGEAGDILRKIVEPHKGKRVLVDFWGTACGPCVYTLKNNRDDRAKIEALGKAALVYITSPSWSPRVEEYEKFAADNGLTHTFRVTEDEWNLLAAMLRINAVPRYVLLDEQGRIENPDYTGHSMSELLK